MKPMAAASRLLLAWVFVLPFVTSQHLSRRRRLPGAVPRSLQEGFSDSVMADVGEDDLLDNEEEDLAQEEEEERDGARRHVADVPCTIVGTSVESWLLVPEDPSSLVSMPKVEVRLNMPPAMGNFSTVYATRYGSGRSMSPPADYGHDGPQGWLRSLRVGEQRTCYQPAWDMQDVRLSVDEQEGDRAEFMLFLHAMHSPLWVLFTCITLFAVCTCCCVRCFRDPGVDVRLPWVRRVCMKAYPVVLLVLYFTGFFATLTIGSNNLQHKFFQPLLFGVNILFWIVYFAVLGDYKCWSRLSTNITLVFGVPCYFMLVWTISFVALVPGYNWMKMITSLIGNTLWVYHMFGIVSAVIVNMSFVVIFIAYRDRIFRAFGIDAGGPICPRFDEIMDPSHRATHYIAVKLVVLDIVGKLPSTKSVGANNLFVQVSACGGDPTKTRVHVGQEAQTADSKIYPFHEVLQIAIPMDPTNIENVYITVMDQGIVSTDEIARCTVPVNDIYAQFLSPSGSHSNTSKEIRIGHKITFWDKKGAQTPIEQAAKAFELTFEDFGGPSYMWLAFLPGNEKAENYLHSLYNGGVLRQFCPCCFGAPAGVGHVDEFEQSEYAELAETMEKSSFQSLTASSRGIR